MAGSTVEYSGVIPTAQDPSAHEEHRFVQRLTQGDTTAFWALWERYRTDRFARQSLYWMGGNPADAADALSSSSLKAWQYLTASAQDIRHMKGALTRLLHNHCMEVWRERQRQAKCISGLLNRRKRDESGAATAQESAEETLLRHEMAVLIRHALDNLPPRLHEAAVLRLVYELSYDEIGVRLHIRPDNARKRIQQARALLQEQLRSYCSAEASSLESTSGFVALKTPLRQSAPELMSVVCTEREEIIPAGTTLRVCRVNLPHGIEKHRYLILDHKPTRQRQKLETLRTYVQQHPNGWKKRRALADLLYTMGRWEEAAAAYQQVVRQHPDCLAAWLRLGEIWRLSDRDDDALTAYTHALSLVEREATRHHIEGLIALCRRQPARAAQAFATATTLETDNRAHWQSLGMTHLYAAQPVEALQAFDEVLQRDSNDLLALTYSPAALDAMGRSSEAQRRATRALSLDPTNVLALTSLLRHLTRAEPGTTSQLLERFLHRALQAAPTSPEVHEALARYHMFRGEWSQGIAVLHAYTRDHPHVPEGWYYAARWFFRSGAVPAAATAIMQAYACDPHDAAILQAACTILLAADRLPEIAPLLHGMLQQFPEYWRVWTTAGHVLLRGYGEKERACTVAARGPHLQPQLAQAWFQYGRVLALAGRHREAIAALRAGQSWLPVEDGEAHALPAAVWLGNSYEALNDVSEARRWWTQAIHLGHRLRLSQPAIAHYWQGKAEMALGQMTNARQAFQTALHRHLFYPARQEVRDILNI